MGRRTTFVLTVLALAALLAAPSQAASKADNLDKLSTEILSALQEFYPVQATQKGIHSYDQRLTDYSSKSVKAMVSRLEGFSRRLKALNAASLDTHQSINHRLLTSNVNAALLDLNRIKWFKRSPQLYVDEAVNGVYSLMLSRHAAVSEKLFPILSRMKAVPDLLSTARKNLQAPAPVHVDLAKETLESASQFYQEVAADLMAQVPGRADEILEVSTKAREAMNDFAVYLAGIQTGSDSSFAVGKENFDYLLKEVYFLDIDSDSLLRIGENLLADLKQQLTQYQTYVDENHQPGKDSVFVPRTFCRQDLLEYYQWETDQIKVFLSESGLITVPDDIAPVTVVETPPFLRSMVAGPAYQPAGPFDQDQEAYFYIRPVPEDLDATQLAARYRYVHRRGFRGSAVHEAVPGHHLQMQIAGRNPDPVRKWQDNPMLSEGWALFCEQWMYEAGLYGNEDPPQWLAILGGQMYRAARIVADVKLHTGQFTYQQCVDWMITTLGAETETDKDYHRKMVRKYTLSPTQWMSYMMGKLEIQRLREAALERSDKFVTEQEFYDALLAEGSIPPALLWEALGLERTSE
jgi:uncharacterized protein (DUF885 family)